MFSFLRNTAKSSSSSQRKALRSRLLLESLEERSLLSFGSVFSLGSEFSDKLEVATASSTNGNSIAVWTRPIVSGVTHIEAQLYGPDGTERGAELTLASTSKHKSQPAVAMDSAGRFVVVWTHHFSSTDKDIHYQAFDADGGARTGELVVAQSDKNEFDPSIGMAANGRFVVSFTKDFSATDQDVMARRFNPNGSAVADSFAVQNLAADDEIASSVAMTDDGRFMVAFQRNSDIQLQRFAANGTRRGGFLDIATSARSERTPSVAMDSSGNAVVAWSDNSDIKARRVTDGGTRGSVLTVRATTAGEANPSVALARNGNSFMVAYDRVIVSGTTAKHVDVTRVTRTNGTDAVQASQDLGLGFAGASISVDGNNAYFVGYVDVFDRRAIGRWGVMGSSAPTAKLAHDFDIELSFNSDMTASQRRIFRQAADRWEQVILGDLPEVALLDNGIVLDVDDLRILASSVPIDGTLDDVDGDGIPDGGTDTDGDGIPDANILGQATFSARRDDSLLPSHGFMEFDTADMAAMEANGKLFNVIVHEMGHVLGLGTLWQDFGLLKNVGTAQVAYTGAQALAAYNAARPFLPAVTEIPVENVGGSGSRDSHWRESVLDTEVMTSKVEAAGVAMPLSRITIGSLADMGYTVNFAAANKYSVPIFLIPLQPAAVARSFDQTPSLVASPSAQLEVDALVEALRGASKANRAALALAW